MLKLRRYFISGLVVLLPLALTVYAFVLTVNLADGLLGKYLEPVFAEKFGFYFRGISIIVGICMVVLIGFFATNFLGKKLHSVFEGLLIRLPFFRQVYPAIKEMALLIFSRDKLSFKQVVVIEFPRKGLYAIGFLTNEQSEVTAVGLRADLCNVFVPNAPTPVTGYVIMVPKKEVMYSEMSVEEAVKLIVSGGVVNPNHVHVKDAW